MICNANHGDDITTPAIVVVFATVNAAAAADAVAVADTGMSKNFAKQWMGVSMASQSLNHTNPRAIVSNQPPSKYHIDREV